MPLGRRDGAAGTGEASLRPSRRFGAVRAIWQMKNGGPEVLTVRETLDPLPGPGEIRIRVRACGLNFAEVMARQGLYPDAPKPPCVLGYEAAGVVDALGPDVDAPAVGTNVVSLTQFGGHADVVCVPVTQVLALPQGMDFETAAAIPVTYLTAYHMLFRVANLQPGAKVLVHMAAGGVGIAALQLCATVPGVETFGTASAGKHDILREEGCTHPIDYRNADYAQRILELTDGAGVDVVLDALGGTDWAKGISLLRPVGHLVAYGFANIAGGERRNLLRLVGQGLRIPRFTPLGLMSSNRSVSGVNIGHLWSEVALLRDELSAVLALWQDGKVRPRIDSVHPFTAADAAHARITERRNIGKVILVP
jgi:NADPH:quinone reductase-like Zn-dependent oxidoreductase